MITVDSENAVPPFEQVRTQIADLIRAGELQSGQKLPSIRQLAGDLRIAPGTVVRAYAALEADGLVEMNRSSGTRVRDGQRLSGDLRDAAARFVRTAHDIEGVTLDDALAAVRAAWDRPA